MTEHFPCPHSGGPTTTHGETCVVVHSVTACNISVQFSHSKQIARRWVELFSLSSFVVECPFHSFGIIDRTSDHRTAMMQKVNENFLSNWNICGHLNGMPANWIICRGDAMRKTNKCQLRESTRFPFWINFPPKEKLPITLCVTVSAKTKANAPLKWKLHNNYCARYLWLRYTSTAWGMRQPRGTCHLHLFSSLRCHWQCYTPSCLQQIKFETQSEKRRENRNVQRCVPDRPTNEALDATKLFNEYNCAGHHSSNSIRIEDMANNYASAVRWSTSPSSVSSSSSLLFLPKV